MIVWLDGRTVGWLDGWLVGWLVGGMVGWADGWLDDCLVGFQQNCVGGIGNRPETFPLTFRPGYRGGSRNFPFHSFLSINPSG